MTYGTVRDEDMIMPSESKPGTEVASGTDRWKIIDGPNDELRIEPHRMRFACVAMLVWTLIFIGIIWFSLGGRDSGLAVVLSLFSAVIGIVIAAFLWFVDHFQQRRGAYLVLNERGLHLREGRHVDFGDFQSLDTFRTWESVGDSKLKVTHLLIVCRSQDRIELVSSEFHGEVKTLKKTLEKHIATWTERLRASECD